MEGQGQISTDCEKDCLLCFLFTIIFCTLFRTRWRTPATKQYSSIVASRSINNHAITVQSCLLGSKFGFRLKFDKLSGLDRV